MKPNCAPSCSRCRQLLAWLLGLAAALPLVAGGSEPTNAASPPQILVEPQNYPTISEGSYVRLEVIATGSMPLFYQWQKVQTNQVTVTNVVDGTNVVSTTNEVVLGDLASGTRSVYTLRAATTNGTGGYRVVVTNTAGAQTSVVATVTVLPQNYREFRLGSAKTLTAERVVFPVQFWAVGDERHLSASLSFRPQVLFNPTVALAPTISNVTVTPDLSEVGAGRLGLTFTLPGGTNALSGFTTLAELGFDRGDEVSFADAALAWGDHPVPLEARNETNDVLVLWSTVYPKVLPEAAPPVFNPQSGLYTQLLTVLNPAAATIVGAKIFVYGLTNDSLGREIRLENAVEQDVSFTNESGTIFFPAYFESGPLEAGGSRQLTAEYYVSDRRTVPTPRYDVSVSQRTLIEPVGFQVAVDRALFTNGVFLVEFATLTNFNYYVLYNWNVVDTNSTWRTALPPLRGTGARMQWMDNGPPKTEATPAGQTNRFYRVIRL